MLPFILLIVGVHKWRTRVTLGSDRIEFRDVIAQEKTKVKYADIVSADAQERGCFSVTYRKNATLISGPSEKSAGAKLKPHNLAKAVAKAVEGARDAALRENPLA